VWGIKNKSGGKKMKKAKIEIEGMHCASCSGNVEKALSKVSGIRDVKVNLLFKKASAEVDDEVTEEQLKNAVKDAGFNPIKVEFS
jgi:copper chaperone CopZ